MNESDFKAPFDEAAPTPDPRAMEAAWTASVCEFHRRIHMQQKPSPARWLWPVAAAAAIAILCGIIAIQPASTTPITPAPSSAPARPNLTQLYTQGRELFGNRLQAVTVSKNRVVWHLSDDASPARSSDQFVTLTLNNPNSPDLHIATNPGSPVNLKYDGRIRQVEFLPDVSDKIIAVGDGIYWDTHTPGSPMRLAQLQSTN